MGESEADSKIIKEKLGVVYNRKKQPLSLYKALKDNPDISIIAEIKKASPSKGIIREDFDHMEIAKAYLESDVQAMSILTERDFFMGREEYLTDVSRISDIPILRKDFIVDEFQIYEAYALGADAVLLIMAELDDKDAKRFKTAADKLSLECLVETHSKEEIERALNIGADIIGINNRDLKTFVTDIKNTEKLIGYIPNDKAIVSESGIKNAADLEYLKSIGADGALIGEAFTGRDDIKKAVCDMRGRREPIG
ncbi:MAG TPA: indole-3-glycerol phosphate synthase TrpC [Firmicutes bacterium]|nr:indole-3-glycerol phosphate synthase TrpC [Bacillota bacterium]